MDKSATLVVEKARGCVFLVGRYLVRRLFRVMACTGLAGDGWLCRVWGMEGLMGGLYFAGCYFNRCNVKKLKRVFYQQRDVVQLARDLIGKVLVTRFGGVETSGRIVETEAYNGVVDRASHAFGGRRSARTEVMYGQAGMGYVYLCYGIHHLFNVVSNERDVPHAILVRAIEPLSGMDVMLERCRKVKLDRRVGSGPGNVSKALGIHTRHTGVDLLGEEVFIGDDGFEYGVDEVVATPRIGVDYAGADALLPFRFIVRGNRYVSGKKGQNGGG